MEVDKQLQVEPVQLDSVWEMMDVARSSCLDSDGRYVLDGDTCSKSSNVTMSVGHWVL